MQSKPSIIVLAGPNGAGKSTVASTLLPVDVPFLNADEVAKALPGYPSREVDILAGRQVLRLMDDFEKRTESFAVETTLAARSLAPRITRLRRSGYRFILYFLWTPNAEFSIQRVAERVRLGGHSIPIETIRRRHVAGLANLFRYYLPLADAWSVLDNTRFGGPWRIAQGESGGAIEVIDPSKWAAICTGVPYESNQ